MANSALMELVAVSGHDQYLTPTLFSSEVLDYDLDENLILNPYIAEYRPTIKAAHVDQKLTMSGTQEFNGTFSVELGKYGADLATGLTLEMTLPPLIMNPDGQGEGEHNNKVAWVANPAHEIVKEAKVEIAGALIEKHIGQWSDVWRDLTLPAGKKEGYNDWIGQQNLLESRIGNESVDQISYLTKDDILILNAADFTPNTVGGLPDATYGIVAVAPTAVDTGVLPVVAGTPANTGSYDGENIGVLEEEGIAIMGYSGPQTYKAQHPAYDITYRYHFWFCDNIQLALPLISISLNVIKVDTTLRSLSEMIRYKNVSQALASADDRIVTDSDTKLTNVNVWMSMVFLEETIRDQFAMLVTQTMLPLTEVINEVTLSGASESKKISANHPVDELIWYVQDKRNISQWYYKYNDYSIYGLPGSSPIITANILFQNQDRSILRNWRYFHMEQPFRFHTNMPKLMSYVYSFSENPEAFQISGTANFSRIDDVTLQLNLSPLLFTTLFDVAPVSTALQVFTRHRNFLRISAGVAGKAFAA